MSLLVFNFKEEGLMARVGQCTAGATVHYLITSLQGAAQAAGEGVILDFALDMRLVTESPTRVG